MKAISLVLGSLLMVFLSGCGTNAKKVEDSVTSAQTTVRLIAEKREETKKEAEKSVQGKWLAATACSTKNDAGQIAVCMLGLAAMDKGGSQVAAAEPLPQIPVLAPQPSTLEKFASAAVGVAGALSPILAEGVRSWRDVEVSKVNSGTQRAMYEFDFKKEQARGDSTVALVDKLSQKGPSVLVNGDLLSGGSAKAGGDLVQNGGTVDKRNCTAGNAGLSTPGSVSGTGTSTVTVPPAPGGQLAINC